MRVPPLLAVFALAVTPGRGQVPPPPPVFTAAVEIVRLDVIVLDRDGKPVTGLGKDDFTVEEDGRAQTVGTFEPVVVRGRLPPPAVEPPRLSLGRIRAPGEGRSFYVFFDDAHVTAPSAEHVRVALRNFIRTGLREGDWVTVMAPQQGLWWTARNAWEYRQLEAVVDRLKGQYVRDPGENFGMSGMSDFEAMCIAEGLPPAMCGVGQVPELAGAESREFRPGAPPGVGGAGGGGAGGSEPTKGVGLVNREFEAREVYAGARHRIDVTFGGLRQALDSLVPLRGHKSLLLVSEGFVLIPRMPGYTDMVDTARRANVAVHFLDPRGLESGYGGEGQPGIGYATSRALDSAGADALAGATGGRTIASNDPGEGLRQIASESEAYYLLGYQPESTGAGERKVKVRVRREGLTVHARSRYYVADAAKGEARREKEGKDETAGRTPEERRAMRAVADTTDLPLRLATLFFEDDGKGRVTTMYATEIRTQVTDAGGRTFATVAEARPRDGGKALRDEFEQELSVRAGVPTMLSRHWHMPPGVWQIRVLVREKATGRIGTALHTFDVPSPGAFRLSTPILTTQLEKADGRDRPRVVLARTFPAGQMLYCQYQVHGAAVDEKDHLPHVVGGWELRHGGTVVRAGEPTRIRPDGDGRLARLLGIALEGLEAGDYELLLTVEDERAGATTTATEPFTVAP